MSISMQVQAALDSAAGRIRESDRMNAQSFIDHGEPVIALELICDQLYEYDIAVSSEAAELIRIAVQAAGIDPAGWAMLRVDDVTGSTHGQIVHLGGVYFRQHHDRELAAPIEAVREFLEKEPAADVEQLSGELQALLGRQESEQVLAELWLETAEAAYDPRSDGLTMNEWFQEMLGALSETT